MAVELIAAHTSDTDRSKVVREYHGLSTDTKPTLSDMSNESTFYEIDTGSGFVYSQSNTNPATTNGWWSVFA